MHTHTHKMNTHTYTNPHGDETRGQGREGSRKKEGEESAVMMAAVWKVR